MTNIPTPLYSNKRIFLACQELAKIYGNPEMARQVEFLMQEMRDNYERDRAFWRDERAATAASLAAAQARIAELEAENGQLSRMVSVEFEQNLTQARTND